MPFLRSRVTLLTEPRMRPLPGGGLPRPNVPGFFGLGLGLITGRSSVSGVGIFKPGWSASMFSQTNGTFGRAARVRARFVEHACMRDVGGGRVASRVGERRTGHDLQLS